MVGPNVIECNSPIIDVSGGFDGYFAHEGRHIRAIFQQERKIAPEVGPVRLGFAVHDDEALNKMMESKSEQ
jgi:hypothetical protein